MESAAAVINLCGSPVMRLWTPQVKREILSSRLEPTVAIREAVSGCSVPPRVWINSSAVGIYGNRGLEVVDEDSAVGNDEEFMVQCCSEWEHAVQTDRCRSVLVRTGIVLDRREGAFKMLRSLALKFAGGAVGDGKQYVSWIHIDDWVRLVAWIISTEIAGPVNAVAPEPIANSDFMKMLRHALHRPWSPPVPAFLLKLISPLTGIECEVVVSGQRVLPKRAVDASFEFLFKSLPETFDTLLSSE